MRIPEARRAILCVMLAGLWNCGGQPSQPPPPAATPPPAPAAVDDADPADDNVPPPAVRTAPVLAN